MSDVLVLIFGPIVFILFASVVVRFAHHDIYDAQYCHGRRDGYAEHNNEEYLKSVALIEYSDKIKPGYKGYWEEKEYHYHKGYVEGFNLRKSE